MKSASSNGCDVGFSDPLSGRHCRLHWWFLISDLSICCQGNSQSQAALSQSQPATQPLEFSQESLAQVASQGPEDGVWGQLFPYCGTFPR